MINSAWDFFWTSCKAGIRLYYPTWTNMKFYLIFSVGSYANVIIQRSNYEVRTRNYATCLRSYYVRGWHFIWHSSLITNGMQPHTDTRRSETLGKITRITDPSLQYVKQTHFPVRRHIQKFLGMLQTMTRSGIAMKNSIFQNITPCSSQSEPTFRRNISPPSSE
jgi:hypothetical protein